MPRGLAAGPAATAVLARAADPAAVDRAGLAAHSGRPDRFEAATAAPVAGRGRKAAVRVVHPTAAPVERTVPAATVATAGLAAVRRRKAAVRVVRPIAGPAAKQVRRGCEKVVHSAAIAAELEPDSEPATAGFVRAAGPVRVAVPTAEERRKESPEPEAAGFVAEPAEQYFDRGSSCLAVAAVAAVGEEAAVPIAGEVLAAGWEWEHIPAVPIVAVRVAVAVGEEAAGSTAAGQVEEHFEVLGSVPTAVVQVAVAAVVEAAGSTAVVRVAVAAVAVVPTAAEQAEERGIGQAEESGSTAAASLAQAAIEQLVLG